MYAVAHNILHNAYNTGTSKACMFVYPCMIQTRALNNPPGCLPVTGHVMEIALGSDYAYCSNISTIVYQVVYLLCIGLSYAAFPAKGGSIS